MKTTIRDNVHGDILIADDVVYDLINTKEFQRLKRINQLGGGQHVFIGASHNRFAHCLGVYHLISKFFENENINSQAPFDDEKNRTVVKVAGLLHDIGHGPFSHSFEKVGNGNIHHEHYSSAIILNVDTEINKVLKKYNIDAEEVAKIIEGRSEKRIMNLLVSSQLDADRLDYLLRDNINAGVSYSKVDVNWIVRHTQIENDKFVFQMKTLFAIESFLLGRYHMYNQVYNHKTSMAFDETLHNWFERLSDLRKEKFNFEGNYDILEPLFSNVEFNVNDYLELDDYSFTEIIKRTAKENDVILKDFANRLINRNFLEAVFVTDDQIEIYRKKVQEENYDMKYYFTEKEIKPVSIYSATKDGKDETIYLIDQDKKIIPISEASAIISNESKNQKNKKIIFIPKN
jgi:HD superfamily phosphohydrolase